MYEGTTIICREIVEEHWLEYLAFVKRQAQDEQDRSEKVRAAIETVTVATGNRIGTLSKGETEPCSSSYRYYDISINGFWNWYITEKV